VSLAALTAEASAMNVARKGMVATEQFKFVRLNQELPSEMQMLRTCISDPTTGYNNHLQAICAMVGKLESEKTEVALIKAINTFVNAYDYQCNSSVMEEEFPWPTSFEFFMGTGINPRCSTGYVVAKYALLKAVMGDEIDMRFHVVPSSVGGRDAEKTLLTIMIDGRILLLGPSAESYTAG